MRRIEKSVLVPYSAGRMFDLVDRVEDYPSFLPWCSRTEVRARDETRLVATVHIDYHRLRTHFTTENRRWPGARIEMRLREGPFTALEGAWQFHALDAQACKVEFVLGYQFASALVEGVVNPVFSLIGGSLIDAFVRRAEELYGR